MGPEIKFSPETGVARDSDGNQIGRAGSVKADPSPMAPGRITFGPLTGGEATTLKGQPFVTPNNSTEYRVDIKQAIAEAKTEAEAIMASVQTSSGSPLLGRRPLSAKDNRRHEDQGRSHRHARLSEA